MIEMISTKFHDHSISTSKNIEGGNLRPPPQSHTSQKSLVLIGLRYMFMVYSQTRIRHQNKRRMLNKDQTDLSNMGCESWQVGVKVTKSYGNRFAQFSNVHDRKREKHQPA